MDTAPPAALKYPHSVGVDFRKLKKSTLGKIIKYYGFEPKPNATRFELAVYAARLFEATGVVEEVIVDKFVDKFCYAGADNPSFFPNTSSNSRKRNRDQMSREPAYPGEQVAAKLSKSEETTWILGNIIDFDPKSQVYTVQDEDDANRVMNMPFHDVRRLEDSSAHLRRGDRVLAVFPETTSFYPAVVAKNPKPPTNNNNTGGWDVIVKFDDDEDETGKNPARRVPARFILRLSGQEGENESEEDD